MKLVDKNDLEHRRNKDRIKLVNKDEAQETIFVNKDRDEEPSHMDKSTQEK